MSDDEPIEIECELCKKSIIRYPEQQDLCCIECFLKRAIQGN